jgi:hypothetical protein
MFVGTMGRPESEFWEITPYQTGLIYKGYLERVKFENREAMVRERWHLANMINFHVPPEKRKVPHKMFPFDWEKAPVPELDKSKFKKLAQKWGGTTKVVRTIKMN